MVARLREWWEGGGAVVLRKGQARLPDGTTLAPRDTILCDPGETGEIMLTGDAYLILIRFHGDGEDRSAGQTRAGG